MAKFVVACPGKQRVIDWTKCVVCQNDTTEKLLCPGDKCGSTNVSGYMSFANILPEFSRLQLFPPGFDPISLDDGSGVIDTLSKNKAKWHKSCRLFFYRTQLERAEKRSRNTDNMLDVDTDDTEHDSKRIVYRRSMSSDSRKSSSSSVYKKCVCFLCDKGADIDSLHCVTTFNVDEKVRECAKVIGDTALLAKLSDGDLMAQEAKYHQKCLLNLYYQGDRQNRSCAFSDGSISLAQSLSWAQLLSYIDETRANCASAPIFKLSDLVSMYTERLLQLRENDTVSSLGDTNRTRLKDRLLKHYPNMRAQTEGRNILLVFDSDIGPALKKACQQDADADAITLARAAEIIRRDTMSYDKPFTGSFSKNCQQDDVPPNLLALISMILEGPGIDDQNVRIDKVSPAVSISQLLVFNSVKHKRDSAHTTNIRRSRCQETPLPIYIGMLLHATTRKRSLVDKFSQLGLCVSYDRVLDLSANLANTVIDLYHNADVVCPPSLCNETFTVAAVDNIDHNLSSTTAQSSFHGTAISLMQLPNVANQTQAKIIDLTPTSSRHIRELPLSYTDVPPIKLIYDQPKVVSTFNVAKPTRVQPITDNAEFEWLENVRHIVDCGFKKDLLTETQWLSWSAFHAANSKSDIFISNIALLPLFQESSNSVSMIKHSIDVVMKAVRFLNPSQIPVITMDQPLYAIAKTIQWNWPTSYGDGRLVVMMGGLHIEMAALKMLGVLLKDSGWVEAVSAAGVATSGTAEALLSASHVRRCRHVHELTCCVLYILQHNAYNEYCSSLTGTDQNTLLFEDWCQNQSSQKAQFAYWSLIKDTELKVLKYVRSLRSSDFQLYVDTLTQLAPMFFALDRTHYARWLSVHIQDMQALADSAPSVYTEFVAGNFTVKKSPNQFSSIAIDHAHEQCNASVKGDGGIIGLTNDDHALRRWAVAGPEIARLIEEFEFQNGSNSQERHHEQNRGTQSSFYRELNAFLDTINEMGNPFVEESTDLIVLNSRLVATASGVSDLRSITSTGQSQYDDFVKQRLLLRSVSVYTPLKRNKLSPFSVCRPANVSKSKKLLTTTKTDCELFSRLYIGCQTRNGSLETFFSHENQPYPPSISEFGTLRFGAKADLLFCLEKNCQVEDKNNSLEIGSSPVVDMMVLDGAVIVQLLKPGNARTFHDYSDDVFCPYVLKQLNRVTRVDLVWDHYDANSLKSTARIKRGAGTRVHIGPSVPMPHKWLEFLRVNENKTDLFNYLSQECAKKDIPESKTLLATLNEAVISASEILRDSVVIQPCNHEEADTRVILHAYHAASVGFKRIAIRTVDTDVVVLAVHFFERIPCDELWIAFGTGKNFRYIPVHLIVLTLKPEMCHALLGFHSFTGCDTTSAFYGRGKKMAWESWCLFPDVSNAFIALQKCPERLSPDKLALLERFTVILYDRTSSQTLVNAARQSLFTRGLQILRIPPTQDALIQHCLRAAFQAGVWSQALVAQCTLPNPADWGWVLTDNTNWTPLWTTIADADKSCLELIRCGCKTGCTTRRCKCVCANLKCTALCSCEGECNSTI